MRVANRNGIEVRAAKFSTPDISGVLRVKDGIHQILVNPNHSPQRQRFTIAHELGHFLLNHQDDPDFVDSDADVLYRGVSDSPELEFDRRMEIQANMFAAALLMPDDLIFAAIRNVRSTFDLAKLFAVSPQAMEVRLRELRGGS